MENLLWSVGVDALLGVAERFPGMWTGASCRLLGSEDGDQHLTGVVVRLTGLFDDQPSFTKIVNTAPLVLDAVIDWNNFARLLIAWRNGQPGEVGEWKVSVSLATDHCTWWPLELETGIRQDRFEPNWQSPYRMWRVDCGGGQLDQALQTAAYDAAKNLGMTPADWSAQYLGIPWSINTKQCTIDLPLGLGLQAERNRDEVEVRVWHRPSLTVEDLWVRIGTGRWEATTPKVELESAATDRPGWALSRATIAVGAEASDVKAWAGLTSEGVVPLWQVTALASADLESAESAPLRAITAWYGLVNRTLGSDVLPPTAPGSRAGQVSDRFEIGLANACSALGYSVLFGGKPLSTAGVDFVAFDHKRRVSFLVSATLANDIADKLRSLLLVWATMQEAIGNDWLAKPVIVTSVARSLLVDSDVADAVGKGVVVVTQDDLIPLAQDPPGIDQLRSLLEGDGGLNWPSSL